MPHLFANHKLTLILSLLLTLAACGTSPDQPADQVIGNCPATQTEPDMPVSTARETKIVSILPPGNWGNFSQAETAAYTAANDPYATDNFNEHVDDQREMYWNFEFKPGKFMDINGATAEHTFNLAPNGVVSIYRDPFHIPVIHGTTLYSGSYGHGYAAANDRMFLLDAARRQASGQFSEMVGDSEYGFDVEQRTITYSAAEYQAVFDGLSTEAQEIANGYLAGVNARIDEFNADPSTLPGEYTVLQLPQIEPYTINEMMALGVFMTRFVASEGGNEFDNVRALQELQAMHGKALGRTIFKDALWVDDRQAAVTVPVGETFTNITTAEADRDAVFENMADYAENLPLDLAEGPGTGTATAPVSLAALTKFIAAPDYSGLMASFTPDSDTVDGASYQVVIGSSRTKNGETLLINGPQLGYTYPTLLWELEFHVESENHHARGVTVPGLPVVGIGYSEKHAWALTTGNSKTKDSFIVELNPANANEYMHNGSFVAMDCRTETIEYRIGVPSVGAPTPVPASADEEICRTVHGPIVARSDDGQYARALQFGMWMREVDTIEAVVGWQSSENFADFQVAMEKATWNENLMYADDQGNIAYFHPGLHPIRSAETDQRLPNPGDGQFDHQGTIDFDNLPHSINPAQGWLANWNNKPAHGWGEGVAGNAISLPAGPDARVTNWHTLLAEKDDWTFEDLLAADRIIGLQDPRALHLVDVLVDRRDNGPDDLFAEIKVLIDIVEAWAKPAEACEAFSEHAFHYNPDIDINDPEAKDRPGETIFDFMVKALRAELFADDLPADLFNRLSAVGNHEYDAPGIDSLLVKVITGDSSYASIQPVYDFTNGVGKAAAIKAALEQAYADLQTEFGGTDPATYTRIHHRDTVDSLSGVIGPSLTMPHQDRGSWIHAVGFDVPE